MWDVMAGFAVVWLIIAIGYLLGRSRILPLESQLIMSRIAFFVASPCLLFLTISQSSITDVVGPQFVIAAVSALGSVVVMFVMNVVFLRGRSAIERVITAQSASQVNAGNLGFPIAAYVLGDMALAAPVIMFQQAIYMPVVITVLGHFTISKSTSSRERVSPRRILFLWLGQTAANPILLGAIGGLIFSWQKWQLSGPLMEAIQLLAGATIPLMLLSFGLSLVGNVPLAKETGRRPDVLIATIIKLVIHPAIAYLLALFVFELEGNMLLAAVVMASLPTAQNVLIIAVRYGGGERIARDSVLLTTALGVPSMILLAALSP